MHELVLPNETNVHGNIFGGKVMYYMDMCAAMSAYCLLYTSDAADE